MNFITDEEVEDALKYLASSAAEFGKLRGNIKFLDLKRKVVRGQAFLESGRKTAAAKTADAESCASYVAILEEIKDAEADYATAQAYITAATMRIDVWRSLNSRRNKGHL